MPAAAAACGERGVPAGPIVRVRLDIMSDSSLTVEQIEAANLGDWRPIGPALQTRFRTGDFATGLRLVNRIGEAAEEANHHPDLDLRYPHLNVRLSSHDVFGITDRDVALARRISELAEIGRASCREREYSSGGGVSY